MDWQFMQEMIPVYIEAARTTLVLGFAGVCLAFIIGIVTALIRHYRVPLLYRLAGLYIELSRNTPLVIQLFFLYFGLPKVGIVLESSTAAIIGLSFLGGSYMAEALRSGLEGVDQSQIDAAEALGFNRLQAFRYILLPQVLATSMPVLVANTIFLIKETSVFSIVAIADLMYVAKEIIGLYYKTDEALFLLVVFYALILIPISALGHYLERRARYASFGNSSSLRT